MNGSSVRVYSKKKFGDMKVSANFKVSEFSCIDGTDTVFISPDLISILQSVRTHFNSTVTISSGYRTETHNKKVGGAEFSQHKYGTAADITVRGKSPQQVYDYVNSIMPTRGGLGLYKKFVHIDVRDNKARWKG